MTTRAEAIQAAAGCIAEAYLILDDPAVPVAEAARRAYTPTGPSMDELVERIEARRAQIARPAQPANPPGAARGGSHKQPA